MKQSKMMRQLYSHCQTWYNITVTEYCPAFLFAQTSYIRYHIKSPALRQKAVNCSVTRTIVGPAQAGLNILKAKTDTLMVGRLSAGFAKGYSMLFLQEALYSNVLRFVNARIPILSQSIPKEFPDNTLPVASDSILSFLVRLITPGLSALFPLMAASIVVPLLPGAASSLEVGR